MTENKNIIPIDVNVKTKAEPVAAKSKFDLEIMSSDFRSWLKLDMDSISWEGKFLNLFDDFWGEVFFSPKTLTIVDVNARLKFLITYNRGGPLKSWLQWLREKWIIFLYLRTGLSLKEMVAQLGLKNEELISLVRDFFTSKYPLFYKELDEFFLINPILDDKIFFSHMDICQKFGLSPDMDGHLNRETLHELEVTLYPEWEDILKLLKKHNATFNWDIKSYLKKIKVKESKRHLKEFLLVIVVSSALIIGLKESAAWYENYVSRKITLFEPNFFWMDKALNFLDDTNSSLAISMSEKEVEKLEEIESRAIFNEETIKGGRFETETEAEITDLDFIPKEFAEADTERSEYEENRKDGYRDTSGGSRKAYRVLLTSVNTQTERDRILAMIEKYKISQVDKVEPGKRVPGGIYFNLNVSQKLTKDFLTELTAGGEAHIFESRPRESWPMNVNRVFVWVKSI